MLWSLKLGKSKKGCDWGYIKLLLNALVVWPKGYLVAK